MIRTVAQARQAVVDEPKRWSAALIEDTTRPQSEYASVHLYATKKGAQDALRTRRDELVKQGYKMTFGTLGRGHCVLERGDDIVCLCLDQRSRRKT